MGQDSSAIPEREGRRDRIQIFNGNMALQTLNWPSRKEQDMKKLSLIVIIMTSLALGGCADMSDTEQRTLSGAAIGTAAG